MEERRNVYLLCREDEIGFEQLDRGRNRLQANL
jgi:hypothetical protein